MWPTTCVMLLMLTFASAAWAREPTGNPVDDKVKLQIPPEDSPAAPVVPYGPEPGLDSELWIGNKAPDFNLDGSRGRPVRLADLRGQWALLVFAEARESFSGLVGIDGDLAKLGVRLYGVCHDGASALKVYAEHEQLSFVLLSDPTRQISQIYGMYDGDSDEIQPGIALLDSKGVVRMTLFGQSLPSSEILQLVKQAVIGPEIRAANVLAAGDWNSKHWTTSAGFEYRF
jgi:peroxiredoxin